MTLKINEIFPKLLMGIRTIEKKVINQGWKEASKLMEQDIVASSERGASPVEGEKRFVEYSPSYKKAIKKGRYGSKKIRPVNLHLSGDMLKSIKSKKTSDGFSISFTKTVKGKNLAEIHSFEGAGKSKTIRKILPSENEEYKKSIKKRAKEHLKKITNEVLTKHIRSIR
jgi:hypothetical protein